MYLVHVEACLLTRLDGILLVFPPKAESFLVLDFNDSFASLHKEMK
jgi:hypothetical protein